MNGPIRFGYHGSPDAAAALVRRAGHEPSAFAFHEYDVTDPFRALRAGELDVMIVKFGRSEPDLVYSAQLSSDARVAVVGAHHPLAARETVGIEELADYEGFECPGRFPAHVWDEVVPPATPAGRPIRRRWRLTGADTMMDVVRRTDAIHISLRSLADIAPPDVRVIDIHDLPPAPVGLAHLPGASPAVRRFVADATLAGSPR